jgi:hypothetical protein
VEEVNEEEKEEETDQIECKTQFFFVVSRKPKNCTGRV